MEYKSRNNIRTLVILVVPLEMVLSYRRNDFGNVFWVGASTFAGDVKYSSMHVHYSLQKEEGEKRRGCHPQRSSRPSASIRRVCFLRAASRAINRLKPK